MNSVNLIGRLTRDPEVRYTTGNNPTAVARFSLAVNDGYGDKERTSFISTVVFGRQAENCEKYLSKGSRIGVSGRLQTGSYEKDGTKFYTTDVVANRVEFLSGGANKNDNVKQEVPQEYESDGFEYVPDDDIPF